MPKKIIDLVLEKKQEINTSVAAAAANQLLAQAAIIGGISSPAWETYMRQFVDVDGQGNLDDAQLSRLKATDGNASAALDRNRAYLVANGMCGQFTREHFEETVVTIDD
jgi:hypothetical protein